MEQLGDDDVRDTVVDGVAEEDDTVVKQAGVDVVGPFPPRRLLDDVRNGVRADVCAHANRGPFYVCDIDRASACKGR